MAKSAAWQRKEGKSPTGGLNAKGRASAKKQGMNLKPPQPEGGSRKDSFCARMGGMKARGFPGGAAGVYQAVEAAIQLRGQAEANQVQDARFGLIQSLGGPASTAVSHILQRLD